MIRNTRYTAGGKIFLKEDGKGVLGLRVVLHDAGHHFDDQLGATATNQEGRFAIQYREEVFPELFETVTELYLSVIDFQGNIVYESEEPVIDDTSPTAELEIALPGAELAYHVQNVHPMPRLTGGIVDREKLDVIDRAVELCTPYRFFGPA